MVNKCSMIGCRSVYGNDKVKLHRYPLTNTTTLPFWIAASNKTEQWRPNKSSRLCGNHFIDSQYRVGHGKGVLKSTAIPIMNISYTHSNYSEEYKDPHSIIDKETLDNEQTTISPLEDYLTLEIDQMSFAQFCKLKEYQFSIQNNKSYDDRVELDENNLDGSNKNNNDNGTETSATKSEELKILKTNETDKTLVSKPPDNKSYVELSSMSDGPTTTVSKFQTLME